MSDPLQKSNSLPMPMHQTVGGAQDPSAASSPRQRELTEKGAARLEEGFEDYLNEQSITTLEKAQRGSRFDPVDAVTEKSAYLQPGV